MVRGSFLKALKVGNGHDYCYNNSWVSADLLMLSIFKVSSDIEYSIETGVSLYHFPEKCVGTYPPLLKKKKIRMEEVTQLEKDGQQ